MTEWLDLLLVIANVGIVWPYAHQLVIILRTHSGGHVSPFLFTWISMAIGLMAWRIAIEGIWLITVPYAILATEAMLIAIFAAYYNGRGKK